MFIHAKPVWLKGKAREMNVTAVFTQRIDCLEGVSLHVAASTFYRLFVNGVFVAFGPARTARGYARVDVLPLSAYATDGENRLQIEVSGYNCSSLSTCLSGGFLCAELRRGDEVLAYTGRDFQSGILESREQYAERYSIQRHFGEIWDLTKGMTDHPTEAYTEKTEFLPRVAPYPHYEDIAASCACVCGVFCDSGIEPQRKNRYSWKYIPLYWGCFEEDEIPRKPYRWLISQEQHPTQHGVSLPITLKAGEYAMLDFSRIECGFLQLSANTEHGADLVVGFSEYCENDCFTYTDINCQNVIECILPEHFDSTWQSFEPYTMRFGIVMVKSGSLTLTGFGVKSFERDMQGARAAQLLTEGQEKIYSAALRSFAHNAVDLYSDCPSRERAGWLCDSYFTGIVEHHFFGRVPVEDAFLENHRLCKHPLLPHGMRAMCYPSDIKVGEDGVPMYIPQWSMWYVLEVKEYLTERSSEVDPELFRESVEGVIEYLSFYENEDGLLENLPSWNFVEWSSANDWTQNVNYPTNFLYAGVLLAAYALYGREEWREKAEWIQKKTAALSFDGELFTDNAVRDADGLLCNTGNTSEACQYYAMLFGDIDLDAPAYARLKGHILSGCAGVAESGRPFTPVNAFIGLYLRIKTLLKLELYEILLDEVELFFGGMADKTGTLWEYRQRKGSHDHGFASYAAYAMCVAAERLAEKEP